MEKITSENSIAERETLYVQWRQDREQASPRSLQGWIADHPDFAEDFVGWAVELPQWEGLEYRRDDPAEEARLAKVGRSVVAEMRARYGMSPAPLFSLADAARRQDLRLKDVAARLGIGVPIVSKLEQRLLRYASLPETLIRKLAETLEIGTEAVQDYLRQPPTLASGAAYQYTGKTAPQVQGQEEFADAIRTCPAMSKADKQVWLAETEA